MISSLSTKSSSTLAGYPGLCLYNTTCVQILVWHILGLTPILMPALAARHLAFSLTPGLLKSVTDCFEVD
jgi:hypothetical protein